jgi:hypothetical protein
MTEAKISNETVAWLRQSAAVGDTYSQVLLFLLERVGTLEQRPIPEAAQSTPSASPPASAGGLVERVGEAMERHHAIGDIEGSWDAQARAAIREVAAWLEGKSWITGVESEGDALEMAAQILSREADR